MSSSTEPTKLISGEIMLHQRDLDTLRRVVTHGWVMSKPTWAREIIADILEQLGQPVQPDEYK